MGWGAGGVARAVGGDGGKGSHCPRLPYPAGHTVFRGMNTERVSQKSSMSESDGRVGRAGAMKPQVWWPVVMESLRDERLVVLGVGRRRRGGEGG